MDDIHALYQKRGYMDRYGIHVWVTLITLVVFFIANSYYYVNNHMKSLDNDWENVRCNPIVMPFAGMIHSEEGVTAAEYTQQNFESCLNDTMRPLAKVSLKPLKNMSRTLMSDLQETGKTAAALHVELDEQTEEAEEEKYDFHTDVKNRMNSSFILLRNFNEIGSKLTGVGYVLTYEAQGLMIFIRSIVNTIVGAFKPFLNQK